MSIVTCPECKKHVSSTTRNCPSCGFDVAGFLDQHLTASCVAIPIGPFEFWETQFYYYSRCRPVSLDAAEAGEIGCHRPLLTLNYFDRSGKKRSCYVGSPAAGLVVAGKIRVETAPDVGYPNQYDTSTFVALRPYRNYAPPEAAPFTEVDWSLALDTENFRAEIGGAVGGFTFGQAILSLALDSGFRAMNQKQVFGTKAELLEAAEALAAVKCFWLPPGVTEDTYHVAR